MSIWTSIGTGEHKIDLTLKMDDGKGWQCPVVLEQDQLEKLSGFHFVLPSSLVEKKIDEKFYETIEQLDQVFKEARLKHAGRINEEKAKDAAVVDRFNSEGGWSRLPMALWATAGGAAGYVMSRLPLFGLASSIAFDVYTLFVGTSPVEGNTGEVKAPVPLPPAPVFTPLTLAQRCKPFATLESAIKNMDVSQGGKYSNINVLIPYLNVLADKIEKGEPYLQALQTLKNRLELLNAVKGYKKAKEALKAFPTKNLQLLPQLKPPAPQPAAEAQATTSGEKKSSEPQKKTEENSLVNALYVGGGALVGGYYGYTVSNQENYKLACQHRVTYLIGEFANNERARQEQAIKTIFERCQALFVDWDEGRMDSCRREIRELKQLVSLYAKLNKVEQLVLKNMAIEQKGITVRLGRDEQTLADFLKKY